MILLLVFDFQQAKDRRASQSTPSGARTAAVTSTLRNNLAGRVDDGDRSEEALLLMMVSMDHP